MKGQDASELVCSWFLCEHCGVVDRDMQRIRADHACQSCGCTSESARLYFPVSIHILVDLVHQAYHSEAPVGPIDGPQTRSIGTIVFFCALREALLFMFLRQHMRAQQLPDRIIDRLLDDNKLARQRFGQLFNSVVGKEWRVAVQEISTERRSFKAVSELMVSASEARNEFMHTGMAWQATDALATDCVNCLPMLTQLFIELHNRYTTKIAYKT